MELFLDILKWAAYWYLFGLSLFFITTSIGILIGKVEQITAGDIVEVIKFSAAGPLLIFITIVVILDKIENHKNKVVWRSRKAKTKHILYGEKDED